MVGLEQRAVTATVGGCGIPKRISMAYMALARPARPTAAIAEVVDLERRPGSSTVLGSCDPPKVGMAVAWRLRRESRNLPSAKECGNARSLDT